MVVWKDGIYIKTYPNQKLYGYTGIVGSQWPKLDQKSEDKSAFIQSNSEVSVGVHFTQIVQIIARTAKGHRDIYSLGKRVSKLAFDLHCVLKTRETITN